MQIAIPGLTTPYTWFEDWGDLPAPDDPGAWAHPGLASAPNGDLLIVDADRPEVHILGADGTHQRAIDLPVAEGHGILLDLQADQAALWVADPGFKLRLRGDGRIKDGPQHGRVLKLDLAGAALLEIGAPEHPVYQEKPFQPTGMTFAGPAHDRSLWIADGYGGGLVHRYTPHGEWLGAIAGGPDDDLRFQTPHAVFVDDRGPEPELLVTDRGRKRIQVFDLDGCFKRVIGLGELTSPSAIARLGDLLIVGELNASLAVLDPDDRLIGRIGDRPEVVTEPDWPNARDAAGNLVRTGRLQPGFFHAPHGLSVGPDGSIFVAEFVTGGRLVRLAPAVAS